ncbi:hypothetical protein [Microcoleus sp. bin38.metabat.b11b12b14.051]|uniref:hypothetical protein n=1 Tax=Microcoleus sp. bin38.metabat.b11b12b14.051 TaxID=2742709 RepID=UPI0025DC8853|nr:hypothetical protein [Microcoleus sp. bin38.metabat.b11b12b14.051]
MVLVCKCDRYIGVKFIADVEGRRKKEEGRRKKINAFSNLQRAQHRGACYIGTVIFLAAQGDCEPSPVVVGCVAMKNSRLAYRESHSDAPDKLSAVQTTIRLTFSQNFFSRKT